jgi:hypothetical protein
LGLFWVVQLISSKKDGTVQRKMIKVALISTLAVNVLVGGDFGDIGNILFLKATSLTLEKLQNYTKTKNMLLAMRGGGLAHKTKATLSKKRNAGHSSSKCR